MGTGFFRTFYSSSSAGPVATLTHKALGQAAAGGVTLIPTKTLAKEMHTRRIYPRHLLHKLYGFPVLISLLEPLASKGFPTSSLSLKLSAKNI